MVKDDITAEQTASKVVSSEEVDSGVSEAQRELQNASGPTVEPASPTAAADVGVGDDGQEPAVQPNACPGSANSSRKRKLLKASDEASASAVSGGGPSTSNGVTKTEGGGEGDEESGSRQAKKKKNRCAVCRKKVGLTGFACRCGGLYCAIHRYSDKHNCTFDYRELGAQEIRRNNPLVIGEKIRKI